MQHINFITYRDNKVLQQENENYMKQHKDSLEAVDPKLALAEQRLEAMFQELVGLAFLLNPLKSTLNQNTCSLMSF